MARAVHSLFKERVNLSGFWRSCSALMTLLLSTTSLLQLLHNDALTLRRAVSHPASRLKTCRHFGDYYNCQLRSNHVFFSMKQHQLSSKASYHRKSSNSANHRRCRSLFLHTFSTFHLTNSPSYWLDSYYNDSTRARHSIWRASVSSNSSKICISLGSSRQQWQHYLFEFIVFF